MYQRIVVPLDGSLLAELSLPEVERLARLTGAPVHLLRVIDLTQFPWYGQFGMAMDFAAADLAVDGETTAAAAYLLKTAERLVSDGIAAGTEVRRGKTAQEVVAATRAGDVIVMASHGRTGVTRWYLGSVAEDILRHARVPVLLIRVTEHATPEGAAAPAVEAFA